MLWWVWWSETWSCLWAIFWNKAFPFSSFPSVILEEATIRESGDDAECQTNASFVLVKTCVDSN